MQKLAGVRYLAKAKARQCTPWLQKSVEMACFQSWSGLMAAATQRAYISSLLGHELDPALVSDEMGDWSQLFEVTS